MSNASSASKAMAPVAVSADVNIKGVGTAVGVTRRYSGLSYEKNKLAVPMSTGANAALIQLFRLFTVHVGVSSAVTRVESPVALNLGNCGT